MESFPIGQGAAAPLRSPGDYEDEGREFGRGYGLPHPLRGFAMTGGRWTGDGGREMKRVEDSVYMTATERSLSMMRRRRSSFRQGS